MIQKNRLFTITTENILPFISITIHGILNKTSITLNKQAIYPNKAPAAL